VHGMRCYGNIMEMRDRAQRLYISPSLVAQHNSNEVLHAQMKL